MSADNTIIILETSGEFRVAHVQCAEEIHWNELERNYNPNTWSKDYIKGYFSRCCIHKDLDSAVKSAIAELDSCPIVEYGIQHIKVDKTFKEICP